MKPVKFFFRVLSRFKYYIVITVGVLLVVFLDKNSIMQSFAYKAEITDLKEEIRKYTEQFRSDSATVVKLKRDPKAIRDIARKQYYMKEDNEEIFVLSDDEQPETEQQ